MDRNAAEQLCSEWLDAWNSCDADALLEYYSDDAYYRDPGVPEGLHGIEEMSPYLERLLATFEGWRWTADEVFPDEKGFFLKWHASIPVGDVTVDETGLDIVFVDEGGLISRNEVYFDRTELAALLQG